MKPLSLEVKPLSFELKPLEIKPLDIHNKSEFAVTQPIVTDSKNKSDSTVDLKVEPLRVDTASDQKSAIDIKPLVIDYCQTVKVAQLPPTCIEQPYHHHFGITFMGMELWGLTFSGKSEMIIQPAPPRPQYHVPCPPPHHQAHLGEPPRHGKQGLRVRVSRPSGEDQR